MLCALQNVVWKTLWKKSCFQLSDVREGFRNLLMQLRQNQISPIECKPNLWELFNAYYMQQSVLLEHKSGETKKKFHNKNHKMTW